MDSEPPVTVSPRNFLDDERYSADHPTFRPQLKLQLAGTTATADPAALLCAAPPARRGRLTPKTNAELFYAANME